MPLSITNIIQSDSGFFVGILGNATLPAATTAGNTVILVISQSNNIVTPVGFVADKTSTFVAPVSGIYRKSNVGAESSWAIAPSSSALVSWTVLEIEGLDPDNPVDTITAGAMSTGTGATLSSGTTPVSATYDGLMLAFHACLDTTTATPGTWSGHTNGFTEVEYVGGTDTGRSLGLSTSLNYSLSLGAFSTTATKTATVGQNSTANVIVYTATGAKRAANVVACTGFEFGTTAGLATGNLGSGIFDAITGTPSVINTDARNGTYCLELAASAAAENCLWQTNGALSAASSTGQRPFRASFKFPSSLPSGNTVLFSLEPTTAVDSVVVRYVSASQKIGLKQGTGTEILSDSTVSANEWISVDLRTDGRTTAHKCDWRVTYTQNGNPIDQTQATATGVVNVGGWAVRIGWTASTTATVRYDDIVVSDQGGHYPLGNYIIQSIVADPSGVLTIPGATTDFQTFTANGTLVAWNATTARNAIDELPVVVGASADGFAQVATSASNYVEIPMTTIDAASNGASIRAVRMLACGWAAATTAATLGFRANDGTGEMTIRSAIDVNFDNTTTPAWVCSMVKGTSRQDWTQAKLDALVFRVGFSTDASPAVGINAIYGEVAMRVGDLIEILFVDGGFYTHFRQDPDSAGIISIIFTTPVGTRGATCSWTNSGTPNSIYVPANTVHEELIGATDIAQMTAVGMEPDPV